MPTDSVDTADLVSQCLAKVPGAQARFYSVYCGLVRNAVARKLARVTGAQPLVSNIDDICSEVFERVFANGCRALEKLQKADSVAPWLVTVAQNRTMDHFRKLTTREKYAAMAVREEAAGYAPGPDEEAMDRERRDEVRAAMDELPSKDRLALTLFFMDGLTYAEIAEMTRTNINTVAARIRRAKTKLRAILEERGHV
jgi:RNA polymerase sigma-70 factor (ECF subfamily)